MQRYLFTDGESAVQEAESDQALQALINQATDTSAVRIWVFNTREWITYAAFVRNNPGFVQKEIVVPVIEQQYAKPVKTGATKGRIKKIVLFGVAAAGIFLIYNFTKIKWEKAAPLHFTAIRPANVPLMDIDSLINDIEYNRGQTIDRSTRNNLRLRNNWPELIDLKLQASRETSSEGTRFSNLVLTIDNSTGNVLDNALVRLQLWKNNQVAASDTFRFANIKYDAPLARNLIQEYKGDSLSVSFESLQSKGFNFCYAASMKNRAGNYADRWFCRAE